MTPPLTTEALVDLVARLRATNPWKKTAIAEDLMREAADAIQQVTAERDEDRAELARLRAEGEAKDRVRDPRVDTQVWTAAASLTEEQRHQPAWLWFSDGYGPTFGRWAGGAGQAPYVRADIALACAATAREGA